MQHGRAVILLVSARTYEFSMNNTQTAGTTTTTTLALDAAKTRQQAMWASGDFAVIGTTLQIVGESLCEAVDLLSTHRVLDVACGNGNATLAAARRFAQVTGVDYVPALLERAAERARAERLTIALREGDAEALPFSDSSFDVVLSTFGTMFAPNHERAAAEMLRVCAPGGTIGLACWTPEGFLGDLLRTVARHVPPAPGARSPLLWGTEAHLRAIFPGTTLRAERKMFTFRYASADHFVDIFRRYYGPTHMAFKALDPAAQSALDGDLKAILARLNTARGALAVPGEYLEAVITR
jgi:SAM-dependent methyltransferase